jgi:hypothetical protein
LPRPWPIIAGILAATLFNHTLGGSVGVWLAHAIPHHVLNRIVAAVFIGFGLWALYPDTLEQEPHAYKAGVFVTTFIAFFLAEMGYKTQLATGALAARIDALADVVLYDARHVARGRAGGFRRRKTGKIYSHAARALCRCRIVHCSRSVYAAAAA